MCHGNGTFSETDNDNDGSAATQNDSWSLVELGSYSLSSYVSSSNDSSSVDSQETDSVLETVQESGTSSSSDGMDNSVPVSGTYTSTATVPSSGTFSNSVDDSVSSNDSTSDSETLTVTDTITDTDLETFSESQLQVGIYAAGSFNLSSVIYNQSSSSSVTEQSADTYTGVETSLDSGSDSSGQEGYDSDGYHLSGNDSGTGQETLSGGDTSTEQSQFSETLYQAGSFSNDSYSLSSYALTETGGDTVTSSSSDTFTSLSSGTDSGNESVDYATVYQGNGTFSETGSGGDGSGATQNDSWSLTELGNLASGVLALSCYSFAEQENSSASSNDSSGWTETLSGTNNAVYDQSDSYTGTDDGSDNDSQSSNSSGALLEQGTATGDVLTLSLVSYSGSGSETGSTSESEGGSWSGQSYSGNDSDSAQSGDSGNYTVSALGSYSNGSFSLSSYVMQGSSTSSVSSGASEQDTLVLPSINSTTINENYGRSDTTGSQDSDAVYQAGVETAGSYANVSYSATDSSVSTGTDGTSAPGYGSGNTWGMTQVQTQTLSGASATDSSSLSFQDSDDTGGGSCYAQTTLTLTVPGLLVNLTPPDASSLPVVGADESSGDGLPLSKPNLGLVQAAGQWLQGTGSAAQEATEPDAAMPMVPGNGGGAPAQASTPEVQRAAGDAGLTPQTLEYVPERDSASYPVSLLPHIPGQGGSTVQLLKASDKKEEPPKSDGSYKLSDFRGKGFVQVWSIRSADGSVQFELKSAEGAFFYGKITIKKGNQKTEKYFGRCIYEPGLNMHNIYGPEGNIKNIHWFNAQAVSGGGNRTRLQQELNKLADQMVKDKVPGVQKDQRFREFFEKQVKAGKITTHKEGDKLVADVVIFMWPEERVETLVSEDNGKTWKWVTLQRGGRNVSPYADNPEMPPKK